MSGRAIQGFFLGGTFRAGSHALQPGCCGNAHAAALPPSFGGVGGAAQLRGASRDMTLLDGSGPAAIQRRGRDAHVEVDPQRLGLVRSGGARLPEAVLAKMEAAFGADFSSVRIHVGPQAGRIGALAFTTGNDIYFAPGQYQPESVHGQQLLGHELAHVVQQRQGRVATPNAGVSIVQDAALEAEADRLGLRAALQPRMAAGPSAQNGGGDLARVGAVQAKRGAYNPWKFLEGISARAALTIVTGVTRASAHVSFANAGGPPTTWVTPESRSGWKGSLPGWLYQVYRRRGGLQRAHDAESAVLIDIEDYIAANPGLTPTQVRFNTSQAICSHCRAAIAAFCNHYGAVNGPHNVAG